MNLCLFYFHISRSSHFCPQEYRKRPTVLVTTIKIGNVGVTLTAATRVYLMEPCLHPAHEIQVYYINLFIYYAYYCIFNVASRF